jgi:hypothetical protein
VRDDLKHALSLARDITDPRRCRSMIIGPAAAPTLATALLAAHADNERMRALPAQLDEMATDAENMTNASDDYIAGWRDATDAVRRHLATPTTAATPGEGA